MKLAISLIICATAPFQMMENTSAWIMKLPHRVFPYLSEERLAINDSILSIPMPDDFCVDEGNDTIYVDNIIFERSRRFISVWKNNSPRILNYTDSTVSAYSNSKELSVYHNLIKSWDTELLKYIGNEAQPEITLILTHHLTRIILDKGATRIDTVVFSNLGDIERLTHHQLDSLREVIRQKKLMEKDSIDETYADNVVNLTDSIPPSTNANDAIATKEEPSRSLWQRIVDWFRRLWEAIFG